MASKACFSDLAFFFFFNLLFSMLVMTICTSISLPELHPPPLPNPEFILPPLTPTSPCTIDKKCSKDATKIDTCAKVLNNGLFKVIYREPPVAPCCCLVEGLADVEAAICLCTAIKASALDVNLKKLPISIDLLANNCGRKLSLDFQFP